MRKSGVFLTTTNAGATDRIFRAVLGVVLQSLLYFLQDGARWIGLIGLITLATAIFSWCPANRLFGWNTASAN